MKNAHSHFPLLLILILTSCSSQQINKQSHVVGLLEFDSQLAYQHVINQVNFGPRTPGSIGHAQIIEYIENELNKNSWYFEEQVFNVSDDKHTNIIAKRGEDEPWIIIGAHYDSRIFADQDPVSSNQLTPVPGANDGASGVSVMLELSRIIPEFINGEIWLVFFDDEDNGNIEGHEWITGSTKFVEQMDGNPDAVIIVDMIGDKDLNIFYEKNSNLTLMKEIWDIANDLGYSEEFHKEYKWSMIDDHTPFVTAGIPAVDIIDFDYPYWHTIQDTPDKISPESLGKIGNTLVAWMESKDLFTR